MQIEEHIPLAPLTTFQVGGSARFFARVKDVEELQAALAFAQEKKLRIFVLGGGSNLLVDEAGFDGLVIKIELMGVEEKDTTLLAAAGESWDALVARAVSKNLWGIENLSGIPGTVGGAVVQNIGAYGQALSGTLTAVEAYDTQAGTVTTLTAKELKSGYRSSIFKHEEGRYIVLRASLTLSTTPAPNTSYKDLLARFESKTPALAELREAVLQIRAAKFPNLLEEGTAGSFFKNPILGEAEAKKIQATYPEMPLFPMPEVSGMKVPLAWLLDHALLLRGTAVGSARLFERQPLVIAVARGGNASDVKKLAALVQDKVRSVLAIEIEPEVTLL